MKIHLLSSAGDGFHAGFAPKWERGTILRHISGEIYLVDRNGTPVKVHKDQLKPACSTDDAIVDEPPADDAIVDGPPADDAIVAGHNNSNQALDLETGSQQTPRNGLRESDTCNGPDGPNLPVIDRRNDDPDPPPQRYNLRPRKRMK
ncbi:hypothetical protein QAD02_003613 [Eretmocerus hayati]|uniref:Uncharacterized protein n=2 Tax=Eretmocerus hayati TaxID=131215 RepID=A0ACC2NM57_9HYME|nr:hypothetical protein QAD02_003245 [Eretmocerus hayati]KAJ8672354.1 hypothetical protein QAD02_003613 [Eretmocerus hayati]